MDILYCLLILNILSSKMNQIKGKYSTGKVWQQKVTYLSQSFLDLQLQQSNSQVEWEVQAWGSKVGQIGRHGKGRHKRQQLSQHGFNFAPTLTAPLPVVSQDVLHNYSILHTIKSQILQMPIAQWKMQSNLRLCGDGKCGNSSWSSVSPKIVIFLAIYTTQIIKWFFTAVDPLRNNWYKHRLAKHLLLLILKLAHTETYGTNWSKV